MAECTIEFDLLNDDVGFDALLGEKSFEASLMQLLNVNALTINKWSRSTRNHDWTRYVVDSCRLCFLRAFPFIIHQVYFKFTQLFGLYFKICTVDFSKGMKIVCCMVKLFYIACSILNFVYMRSADFFSRCRACASDDSDDTCGGRAEWIIGLERPFCRAIVGNPNWN